MNIKSILEDEYCLNDVYIEKISYGLIDRNYKIISSQGVFFFKIYNSILPFEYEKLHEDLRALKKSNIPVPVEIIREKICKDSKNFYALYNFIDGEKYNSSILQMKSVAKIFCKVIQFGFKNKVQLCTKALLIELEDNIHKLFLLTGNKKLPKEIQEICLDYYYLSKKVKKRLSLYLPKKLDSIPLHPDFTERNLLFVDDSVVLLCDWQGYCYRILIDEIFCTFARFCIYSPFEGFLLEERMLEFKYELIKNNKVIYNSIKQYSHLFIWLLIRRQICNTPFRVNGVFETNERKDLMIKIILWSRDFIKWLIYNENMLIEFFRE